MIDKDKVYYLASAYSSGRDFVSAEDREHFKINNYEAIDYVATLLINEGYIVIEPIAQCHPKHLKYKLQHGFEFWKRRDLAYIDICAGVIVFTDICGYWRKSTGVTGEIEHARSTGKPIYFLSLIDGKLTWR